MTVDWLVGSQIETGVKSVLFIYAFDLMFIRNNIPTWSPITQTIRINTSIHFIYLSERRVERSLLKHLNMPRV